MSKRVFVAALAVILLATVHVGRAQQAAEKRTRIGWLAASVSGSSTPAAVRQGLRERGYIEGQHFSFLFRIAEGKFERLPVLAAELVDQKVNLILTQGSTATRAAKEATSTIPIVMLQDNDPVANGFIASLA